MGSDKKAYITFGAQMGDEKSADMVRPHLIFLRKLLVDYCPGPYADGIDEFAPIARIDGDIWYWNFEGCQKLRLSKKGKYVTVDIGMPKNKWEKASSLEIRKYLVENLKEALKLMVEKLKKSGYVVKDKQLFEDFAKLEVEYLKI